MEHGNPSWSGVETCSVLDPLYRERDNGIVALVEKQTGCDERGYDKPEESHREELFYQYQWIRDLIGREIAPQALPQGLGGVELVVGGPWNDVSGPRPSTAQSDVWVKNSRSDRDQQRQSESRGEFACWIAVSEYQCAWASWPRNKFSQVRPIIHYHVRLPTVQPLLPISLGVISCLDPPFPPSEYLEHCIMQTCRFTFC